MIFEAMMMYAAIK